MFYFREVREHSILIMRSPNLQFASRSSARPPAAEPALDHRARVRDGACGGEFALGQEAWRSTFATAARDRFGRPKASPRCRRENAATPIERQRTASEARSRGARDAAQRRVPRGATAADCAAPHCRSAGSSARASASTTVKTPPNTRCIGGSNTRSCRRRERAQMAAVTPSGCPTRRILK
jgi:hypothetical protein